MDTQTGDVGELTEELARRLGERLGREPTPGDRVTDAPGETRVVISAEAARRIARDRNERHRLEREGRPRQKRKLTKHEKGRARRKRREARQRARG